MKTLFMKMFIASLAWMLIIGFAGCSNDSAGSVASDGSTTTTSTSDDGTTTSAVVPASADGGASKGPFKEGSLVVAYKLENGVRSADINATTNTVDGRGHFDFGESINWTGPTEFVISGEYLNENTGTYMLLSPDNGLRAVVNMVEGITETININILTDIATPAIKAALASSVPIEQATADAQDSVAELFNLDLSSGVDLTDLDLTDATENVEANTQLLMISAALLNTNNPEQVLDQLAEDMVDGGVDDGALAALDELKEEVATVDLQAVATTMEEADIGVTDAPDAESALDGTLAFDHTMSFDDKVDALVSREYESAEIAVNGIYGETGAISIVDGTYSIDGGAFVSSAGTVSNGQMIRVKTTSSSSYSTAVEAKLTIGGGLITYKVITEADPFVEDTTPNDFSFGFKRDIVAGASVDSDPITITGINTPTPISVDSGTFTVNGGASATVSNGDVVVVTNTAGALGTQVDSVVTIGDVEGKFSIFTQAEDTTPDSFSFDDVNDVARSITVESEIVPIFGINTDASISIVGGEYSINGGAYTSADGLMPLTTLVGEGLRIKLTSSAEYSSEKVATVTVGNMVVTFKVTTMSDPFVPDTTPDEFSFDTILNSDISTVETSNSFMLSGINTAADISVENGTYSIGGAFTDADGTVLNGAVVTLRQTTSADFDTENVTTLTIGGVSATFKTRTILEDKTPNDFSFDTVLDVNTDTEIISNTVTISGINTAVTLSVENGTYDTNSTSGTGLISNGDTLTIHQVSASGQEETKVTTVTVGSVVRSFTTKTVLNSPSISGTPATTVDEDSMYSFEPTIEADSGEITSWEITNKPAWASFDTDYGILSGIPENDDVGTYADINITARNSTGISSIVIASLEVVNTNDAPVIDPIADVVVDEDYGTTSILTTVVDVDVPNNLNLSVASSNPSIASVSMDGANIIVTSGTNVNGSVTITLTADDGIVSVDETFTFTVNPVNDLSVWTMPTQDSVDEDFADFTIELNATDVDGPVTYALVSADGVVASVNNSTLSVSSIQDFNGPATVVVSATESGVSVEYSIEITVNPVNDLTVWNTPEVQADKDEDFAEFTIALDATDVDGGVITYTLNGAATGVEAVISGSTLTITALEDVNGAALVPVMATEDGVGVSLDITFNINPVNDDSVWQTPTLIPSVDEDFAEFTVTLDATDVDGAVTYALVSNADGVVEASVSGSILTITPIADANGNSNIVVSATQDGVSIEQTMTLVVNPINDAPVAVDDAIDVIKNTPYEGVLPATDVDIGDVLTYVVSAATQGTVEVIDAVTGDYIYTPEANTTGTAEFTFTVTDVAGDESTATVNVTVSEPVVTIVTTDDTADVLEDANVTIDVLANDVSTNEATDPVTTTTGTNFGTYVSAVTQASNGTVTIVGTNVLYVPNPDFNGQDTFTYIATTVSGDESPETLVTVTVTPVNDPTVWNMEVAFTDVDEDFTEDFSVELNATDIDGPVTYALVATGGLVNAEVTGSTLTLTPIADANGDTTITVSATEGGVSVEHTFTLTVLPVDDPTVWVTSANQPAVNEDFGEFTIELNATDVDGPVVYELNAPPTGVDVVLNGSILTVTSLENENGVATISVAANEDTIGSTAVILDITFDINPVNDAPTITTSGDIEVVEDSGETIVDINIADIDFTLDPANVVMFSSDDTIATVLDGNETSVTILAQDNATGDVTITIRAVDGEFTVEENFIFTLTPVNDAPVANDDVFDAVMNTTSTNWDILGNDFDPDIGTTLEIVSCDATSQEGGSVSFDVTEVLSYTPATDFVGEDTFSCTITDGEFEDTSLVSVNVSGNHAPTLMSENTAITVLMDSTTVLNVPAYDDDNDTLTYTIGIDGEYGSAHDINPETGVFVYNAFSFVANDTITVNVSDGITTVTATFYINIAEVSVNDWQLYEYSEGEKITLEDYNDLIPIDIPRDTKLYGFWGSYTDENNNTILNNDYLEFLTSGELIISDENETLFGYQTPNIFAEISAGSSTYDAANKMVEFKMIDTLDSTEIYDLLDIRMPPESYAYKVAVLFLPEEYDFWEEVKDYSQTPEATYSSFEELVDTGAIIQYNESNPNVVLVFDTAIAYADSNGNGQIFEVDMTNVYLNGGEPYVLDYNAGSWEIVQSADVNDGLSDIIKVTPTNADTFEQTIFVVDNFGVEGSATNTVWKGEYREENTVEIEYRFNDVSSSVIENFANPVTALDFSENEIGGDIDEAEFNALSAVATLDNVGDIYELDVYFDENQEAVYDLTELNFGTSGVADNLEITEFINGIADGPAEILTYVTDGDGVTTISNANGDVYKMKVTDILDSTDITTLAGFSMPASAQYYEIAGLRLADELWWDGEAQFMRTDGSTASSDSLVNMIDTIHLENDISFATRYDEVNGDMYALAFASDSNSSLDSGDLLEVLVGDTNAVYAGTWAREFINGEEIISINTNGAYDDSLVFGMNGELTVQRGEIERAGEGDISYYANTSAKDIMQTNFENISTTSVSTSSLIGSWVYDESTDGTMRNVLTFLDDSNYIIFHEHDDTAGGTQTAGSSEQGTYVWDGTNVIFTLVAESDGDGGFTDIFGTPTPMTLSSDGNILTLNMGDLIDFTKVTDLSNTMVGSWTLMDGADEYTLTILSPSEYSLVHAALDPNNAIPEYLYGEFGTFSTDAATGYTTFVQSVDTDGLEGLSDIGTDIILNEDPGVLLNFETSTENFTFLRLE